MRLKFAAVVGIIPLLLLLFQIKPLSLTPRLALFLHDAQLQADQLLGDVTALPPEEKTIPTNNDVCPDEDSHDSSNPQIESAQVLLGGDASIHLYPLIGSLQRLVYIPASLPIIPGDPPPRR
jgi:hypothetical protein